MTDKKQIEEMAKLACTCFDGNCKGCPFDFYPPCPPKASATRLYNAGYRKQEWVSVAERLPNKTQDYLVVLNGEDIDIRLFNSRNEPYQTYFSMMDKFLFLDTRGDWHTTDRVTHWMPLPEPPKMKGGAE